MAEHKTHRAPTVRSGLRAKATRSSLRMAITPSPPKRRADLRLTLGARIVYRGGGRYPYSPLAFYLHAPGARPLARPGRPRRAAPTTARLIGSSVGAALRGCPPFCRRAPGSSRSGMGRVSCAARIPNFAAEKHNPDLTVGARSARRRPIPRHAGGLFSRFPAPESRIPPSLLDYVYAL